MLEQLKLQSLATFTSSHNIDVFHYKMFHGKELAPTERHVFGGDLCRPVRLIRDVWRIPEIFQPATNLVVSQAVRTKLERFPNIEFAPVEFARTFSCPYRSGDFSFYDSPEFIDNPGIADTREFLGRFPPVLPRDYPIGPYYELVAPRLGDIKQNYDDLKETSCRPTEMYGDVDLQLSHRLVRDFPIFWAMCMFFDSDSFSSIANHIDWDYFETTTVDL